MQTGPQSRYRLVYSPDQIRSRVEELGKDIWKWASAAEQRSGKQVLAVCVLRGAVFFFADLLRAVEISVEPVFCRSRAYSEQGELLSGEAEGFGIEAGDLGPIEGRSVLIVDDICDTGGTLLRLERLLQARNALEIRSAVIVTRVQPEPRFQPTWSGFAYDGPEWFVGYGMDDNNRGRNLDGLYVIPPSATG